jgi:hypothetical protein
MKKITKNSFENLRNSFPILTIESLKAILGGTVSTDCVLNCFAYTGCNGYTRDHWDGILENSFGYSTASIGGVNTSDYSALGAAGGMAVNKPAEVSINPYTGKENSGAYIMMEFPGANGLGHAVMVTGMEAENGRQYVKYYDPTKKEYGRRTVGDWSQLYTLSCTGNSSGSSSSSGSNNYSSSSGSSGDDDFYTVNGSSSSASYSSDNSSSPSGGSSSNGGTSNYSSGDSSNSSYY